MCSTTTNSWSDCKADHVRDAVANAAPAPVIKSMALVPVASYAAPSAPQSKGSVTQTRLHINTRHVDEIREDIFGFSMPQMVEEIAKHLCAEPPNQGGTPRTFAANQKKKLSTL